MIARHWRGWTRPEDADAYESLLRESVLPHIHQLEGHCGGYVLRKDSPDESEFIVINFFDSIEGVKRFAGPDYQVAIFEPEARRLLSRIEPVAHHYEVAISQP